VTRERIEVVVRPTEPGDFDAIVEMSRAVYPGSPPWTVAQLVSHRDHFPEGQLVAADATSGRIAGMASSLVILWDDYAPAASWRDFTDAGMFTNHDPEQGRTLYGAEVMVHPDLQGRGIGKALYAARRELVRRLGLLRIRAGARLRGYHRYASTMSAEEYVRRVVHGELSDATLSFQLKEGFRVFGVVQSYLRHDPASLGCAALIEWLNPERARPEDWAGRDPQFD